jgi:hypothetical protein
LGIFGVAAVNGALLIAPSLGDRFDADLPMAIDDLLTAPPRILPDQSVVNSMAAWAR